MSPQSNTVSDRSSETPRRPPGRPPVPRGALLDAVGAVVDAADSPHTITMDAVAAAAGVGKGTVFRAFGDRNGMLDALVASRFAGLHAAVTDGAGEFAETVTPRRRIEALLEAVLDLKLSSRKLMRAREVASTTSNLASERYRWMHEVLQRWIEYLGPAPSLPASYLAHALLLPLQIDVVDQMLEEGMSTIELARRHRQYRDTLLGTQELRSRPSSSRARPHRDGRS